MARNEITALPFNPASPYSPHCLWSWRVPSSSSTMIPPIHIYVDSYTTLSTLVCIVTESYQITDITQARPIAQHDSINSSLSPDQSTASTRTESTSIRHVLVGTPRYRQRRTLSGSRVVLHHPTLSWRFVRRQRLERPRSRTPGRPGSRTQAGHGGEQPVVGRIVRFDLERGYRRGSRRWTSRGEL